MRNKTILICFVFIIFSSTSSVAAGMSFGDALKNLMKDNLGMDASNAIRNIGFNCSDPSRFQQNYVMFINEVRRLAAGLGEVAAATGKMLAIKPDYPNFCHVMSRKHLNTYSESIFKTYGKTKAGLKIVNETPVPNYYWPKVFIEASEKGMDSHKSFAHNNAFYSMNRAISDKLNGPKNNLSVNKFFGLLLGTLFGGDTSSASEILALAPVENLRLTANAGANSTLESSIWPVAFSHEIAKSFTVCGPVLSDQGRNAGGYKWPVEGAPYFCPIATTSDAGAYWDNGVLDYFDPKSLKAIMESSLPGKCQLNHIQKRLEDSPLMSESLGSVSEISESMQDNPMRSALLGCSFPILGSVEGVLSKFASMTKTSSWRDITCSPWGQVYPRSSSTILKNDYMFANTALKFELFASDIFGVKRGKAERWSLAYPWESSRGRKLFVPGDPLLIDTSLSNKVQLGKIRAKEVTANIALESMPTEAGMLAGLAHYKGIKRGKVNSLNGDRRIYTSFEKITCQYPSTKTTIAPGTPFETTKYSDCQSAVRFEALKLIQLKYLRAACDMSGQLLGLPWKN